MYQLGQILVTTVTKVDKEYQVSNLLTMRNNDRTRVNNQFCNAWVWFALPQALLDSVSARQGEEATMETRVSQKNQNSKFWYATNPTGFHRLDEPPEKISAL